MRSSRRFLPGRLSRLAAAALVAPLLLAACSSGPASTPPAVAPGSAGGAGGGTTLTTEPSPFGQVLATGSGQTLYAFALDGPGRSACIDKTCTLLWPPLVVQSTPEVSGGVQAMLVGVMTRPDHTRQATYAGNPLYTYKEDIAPHQITGQAVLQSGGRWYVISPSGQVITTRPPGTKAP